MKRKLLCLALAALMCAAAMACKKEEEAPAPELTPEPTPQAEIVVVEQMPVHSDTWEDILAEEVPPPEPTPGIISATTGREVDAERIFRPVFVSMDNAAAGRPLSGIAEADIVYEAPALDGSGGTRLLALFSDQYPARVGPVGKTYADLAGVQKEWGGIFVHEDNSEDKAYFFTPEDAKGTFTDLAKLVPALYTEAPPEADVRFLLAEGYTYADAASAGRFRLSFGGGKGETVEYVFDPEAGMYMRYQAAADGSMAGATALSWNEENAALESVPLYVGSVIAQYVEFSGGMPVLVGTGECDFFVGGARVPGTWSRASEADVTAYYLEDGSVVTMEGGHTWIALHPADKPAQVL